MRVYQIPPPGQYKIIVYQIHLFLLELNKIQATDVNNKKQLLLDNGFNIIIFVSMVPLYKIAIRRLIEFFVSYKPDRKGNLLSVIGAFFLLISLTCPWFIIEHRFSTDSLSGINILLYSLKGEMPLTAITGPVILIVVSLLLLGKKPSAKSGLYALVILIAVGFTAASIPGFPNSISPGLLITASGILLVATETLIFSLKQPKKA